MGSFAYDIAEISANVTSAVFNAWQIFKISDQILMTAAKALFGWNSAQEQYTLNCYCYTLWLLIPHFAIYIFCAIFVLLDRCLRAYFRVFFFISIHPLSLFLAQSLFYISKVEDALKQFLSVFHWNRYTFKRFPFIIIRLYVLLSRALLMAHGDMLVIYL